MFTTLLHHTFQCKKALWLPVFIGLFIHCY